MTDALGVHAGLLLLAVPAAFLLLDLLRARRRLRALQRDVAAPEDEPGFAALRETARRLLGAMQGDGP